MAAGEPGSEARSLLALDPLQLEGRVVELGGRPFHARILRREVLGRGNLDLESMSSLPKPLRRALAEELSILGGRELDRRTAPDGASRLLLGLPARAGSGEQASAVEVVHIPSRRPDRGATLCISTQVGCPVACPFCASGLLGLDRNLASWEILEQILRGRALGPLSRLVVMGIGEPLLNWTDVREALGVANGEMGLGARRTTLSTVGFPDRLRRIAPTRPPFQLAISLHTPDDAQRDELVPAMAGVPVEEVLDAGDFWFEVTGREVTYELVLLAGVNDHPALAEHLARRLRGRRATVNLIPYNPVDETPFRRPERPAVEAFRDLLIDRGQVTTVRWSRGLATDAACGQLRIRRTRRSPTYRPARGRELR